MLNVASVVSDPRFTQSVTRMQRAETINQYGESVITSTSTTIAAVITSPGKTGLMRFEDAQTYQDTIKVTTTSPLNGPTATSQPDLIVWQGQNYAVTIVNDYAQFGYTRAICKLIDLQGRPNA